MKRFTESELKEFFNLIASQDLIDLSDSEKKEDWLEYDCAFHDWVLDRLGGERLDDEEAKSDLSDYHYLISEDVLAKETTRKMS